MEIRTMRFLQIGVAASLSLLALSSAALAADARIGAMVKTSDGKRVGRIYAIDDGQTAVILKGEKAIKIAVSTLSGEGKDLTTSLTAADVAKQK
jgi:hypothetical protein